MEPCLDPLLDEPGGASDPLLESETIASRFLFLGFPKQQQNELMCHPVTSSKTLRIQGYHFSIFWLML